MGRKGVAKINNKIQGGGIVRPRRRPGYGWNVDKFFVY